MYTDPVETLKMINVSQTLIKTLLVIIETSWWHHCLFGCDFLTTPFCLSPVFVFINLSSIFISFLILSEAVAASAPGFTKASLMLELTRSSS